MKKDQMQEIIDHQNKEINSLKNKIKDIEKENINNIELLKSNMENLFYENWKQMNGAFVKRFISEILSNRELYFSFDEDYMGYFTMNVNVDDKKISSYDGQIIMYNNGLEE